MTVILGFGLTETEFEEAERLAFEQKVAELYQESGEMYFTEEVISKVRRWLDKRGHEYREKDRGFKTAADFPDRYSSYYPHVIGDASHIVAVMYFIHTNRRHALSPDGWAALSTRACFCVRGSDLDLLKAAA